GPQFGGVNYPLAVDESATSAFDRPGNAENSGADPALFAMIAEIALDGVNGGSIPGHWQMIDGTKYIARQHGKARRGSADVAEQGLFAGHVAFASERGRPIHLFAGGRDVPLQSGPHSNSTDPAPPARTIFPFRIVYNKTYRSTPWRLQYGTDRHCLGRDGE